VLTKWDHRYLGNAEYWAQFSKDPSTKVGACIYDSLGRPISNGYNGFTEGVSDDVATLPRDDKLRLTLHGETNAILFAERSIRGCIIAVTHPPCAQCASLLAQVGIVKVVTRKPEEQFAERWKRDYYLAQWVYEQKEIEYWEL